MVKYVTENDQLSLTFGALADPTRREILKALMNGESSVTDLAKPFQISLPGISKHLKVLERAGLIERSREAQWRRCKLKAKPLKEANEWIDKYKQLWEERLDRLDEYLRDIQNRDMDVTIKLGDKSILRKNNKLKDQ
jgi:DNA-binding transcriptional ArsR family regulator